MRRRYSLGPAQPAPGEVPSTVIELAERPADTSPPRLPAGWYDPDSSAFEPALGAAATTDATAAGRLPANGVRESERTVEGATDEGLPAR